MEFCYIAVGSGGEEARGLVEADSPEKAARALHERGLFVVELEPMNPLGLNRLRADIADPYGPGSETE